MGATRLANATGLLRATVLAVLVGFSAAGVVRADSRGMDVAAAESLFQGLIEERDIGLLLGYLGEATRAITQGREPPLPPPELETRAGSLAAELKARGTLAALMVLTLLEDQAKALRRELAPRPPSALPPTVPYTPVSGGG